jgi:hypothetical protein
MSDDPINFFARSNNEMVSGTQYELILFIYSFIEFTKIDK